MVLFSNKLLWSIVGPGSTCPLYRLFPALTRPELLIAAAGCGCGSVTLADFVA